MTASSNVPSLSLVALVTDVVRDGRRVVGYGFDSNGRYRQGGLIRERFAPRLLAADPKSLREGFGVGVQTWMLRYPWSRRGTNTDWAHLIGERSHERRSPIEFT